MNISSVKDNEYDPETGNSGTVANDLFSKYDYNTLTNMWSLDARYLKKLSQKSLYYCKLSLFLDSLREEKYPETYQDSFQLHGKFYFVTYVGCSHAWLVDLEEEKPDSVIAISCRINYQNRLYCCLVILLTIEASLDSLKRYGSVELKLASVLAPELR